MKTWQAALAHIGITALQATAVVPFFDNTSVGGALGNIYTQVGVQTGLSLLQAWVANKNSKTDPNGKPLAEVADGKFVTVSK